MLRGKAWIVLLAIIIFMPAKIIWAQDMIYGKWWHDRSLIKELQLSDSERQDLEEKYVESRRIMFDLKNEIEKLGFELDLLLGAKDATKQEIMDRYDSLENVRSKLSRERFKMLMEVRETIGAERFEELKIMYRDRGRHDRMRYSRDRRPYRQGEGYKEGERYDD